MVFLAAKFHNTAVSSIPKSSIHSSSLILPSFIRSQSILSLAGYSLFVRSPSIRLFSVCPSSLHQAILCLSVLPPSGYSLFVHPPSIRLFSVCTSSLHQAILCLSVLPPSGYSLFVHPPSIRLFSVCPSSLHQAILCSSFLPPSDYTSIHSSILLSICPSYVPKTPQGI